MATVYEIMTKISLQNGVSAGLTAMAAGVLGLQGHFKSLEKSIRDFDRTGRAVLGGVGLVLGGAVALGLKAAADRAKELSHELVQIQKLGINSAQFGAAKAAAFGLHAQVPGATSVDALKIYGQTYAMLGHENALKMLKPLAEFAQVVGNTTGNYEKATEGLNSAIRAGDLIGKFVNDTTRQLDIGKLQHFLDLGAKVTAATHGRVSSETWLGMAQQGGPALSGMSDKGLESMAIIAQVMGGQRAGTAMSSVFQQFVGGRMWKMQGEELEKFGLVGHGAVTKGGHMTWTKEALNTPFTRAMREDPLKAAEIMQGAMSKGGITNINDQIAELFRMLGRSTEVRLVADMLRNMPQMLAERGRLEGGLGVAASMTKQQAEDYTQVMHNFDAAWTEMMMHIGLPITKAAIPVLKEFTRVFDAVAEFAKTNPDEIKKIATAIGWFSAVLIGAGVVALISAIGVGGWFVGAIGALIALKWETFGPPLTAFVSAMASFAAISWDIFVVGFKGLVGLVKELVSIIGDAGSWLRNKLGISYEGGGDFSGGIINASYGGAAKSLSGGLGRGGGGGRYASRMQLLGRDVVGGGIGTGTGAGVKGVIDAAAARHGVDPRIMYGIIAGESAHGNKYDSNTRGESSWSMFQLNRAGGLGNVFERQHPGMDVRDPHSIPAIADFVAAYAASGKSLSPWRGYHGNRDWNQHWGSMGYSPPHPNHGKIGTVVPFHKGGRGTMHVENVLHLDGEVIHRSTVKHMVASAEHSRQAPHFNGYGMYSGPDRQTATS